MRVAEISASDTHALRREVLRNGDPTRDVVFAGDELAGTVHLAVIDATNVIVAVSTWIPQPCPFAPHARSVQLRGMATATGQQSTGVGGVLFESGVARCQSAGYEVVWARARDAALEFYLRHGCAIEGEGFVDEVTQLPHHFVVRTLAGAAPR